MAITIQQEGPHSVIISVTGQFDYRVKTEIQKLVASMGGFARYCFDFGETSRLHSTGVGLLIGLRQQLGGSRANVCLSNCGEEIMQVLAQAGVLNLFTVYPAVARASA